MLGYILTVVSGNKLTGTWHVCTVQHMAAPTLDSKCSRSSDFHTTASTGVTTPSLGHFGQRFPRAERFSKQNTCTQKYEANIFGKAHNKQLGIVLTG